MKKMKSQFIKTSLLIITLTLISTNINAQFAGGKNKKNNFMFAAGGGASVVDFSRMSLTGGNIAIEVRKPFVHLGRSSSLSANIMLSASMGTKAITGTSDEFGFTPAGLLTISFNGFSQSSKIAKQLFGGFLGVGAIITPSQSINYTKGERSINEKSGMFGPAIIFGPRFRIGNIFMDLRAFGGVTYGGDTELTYAGFNLMFTLGMNRSRRYGLQ